ncbi:MAG TPA: hypothetical protein VN700_20535 [Vicinamibacterales bacterium]|nr:hypothetical protein [Vicinamibacterales bacterium]
MRRARRQITAWAVTASLVVAVVLPAFEKPAVADPDGACGPVLVLAHSIEHFEAPVAAPTDHCAMCHLWNAMANASISDSAQVTAPDEAVDTDSPRSPHRAYTSDLSPSSPRGPPAIA